MLVQIKQFNTEHRKSGFRWIACACARIESDSKSKRLHFELCHIIFCIRTMVAKQSPQYRHGEKPITHKIYCAVCEVRLLFDIYRFWSAPLNMRTNSSSSLRSIERSINRQSNDGFYEIDRLTRYRRFAYFNEFPLQIVGMHDCVIWIALHVFDKIVAKSR